MSSEKSKPTRVFIAAQASAHSNDTAPPQQMNIQMVQNVMLIWLDANIDEGDADCRNTITQLRRVVHTIHQHTDEKQCIDFLQSIGKDKACMVISGSLGQKVVPQVHDMFQVDSIFIFCGNKKFHEQWAEQWPKIKGVFTEVGRICEALKVAAQRCEQDAVSISIMDTTTDPSNQKLDQLEPSFMYTQLLKEILLSIKFKQQHIDAFIEYSREALAGNKDELANLQQFEQEYRERTPTWWYTCQCFLYPMLNRALWTMDADLIVRMGFFIGDLHRHIEQLHQQQFSGVNSDESFTVYRGQGLPKADFEKLSQTKGGLLSFNNFLSTSKKRNVSLRFAEEALPNAEKVGVHFVMTIDPAQSNTPFASIIDVSCFKDEEEVLFSMHTVFRIGEITSMDENDRLFQVTLTLTSDNDKDLRVLMDRIREETFPNAEGWYRLGEVLKKMGQFDKAQQVYEILLEQTTDELEKGGIYNQLGAIHRNKGEYAKAITFYEKSLEIYKKTLPPTHLNLASSYNNIGLVYYSMGDYPLALSYYEKALAIQQQSLPPNHSDLADSYNNIGLVYDSMGDYPQALSYYEKSLAIRQQSLPPNHPDLAMSYNNIGAVYYSMGDYPQALSYYEKALAIRQQSLPPNHPHLADSYNNIGVVYCSMGDYPQALSYYEKALAIQQQSLPPNHPDFAKCHITIGNVYYSMGDYPQALSYYEKSLAIRQQSLPPNHPHLADSYNNIGVVYYSMGDYPQALSYYEKALAIQQQSLPPNHPDLAMSYNNIGNVYCSMGDYPQGLSYYEKDLQITKQSLPPNHPSFAMSYNNIGLLYENMKNYSEARSFYERAVDIAQRSLPSGHPDLKMMRNNLEDMKKKL